MIARANFLPFVERARRLPALPAAFVYPCDRDSLQHALSSAFTGALAPLLVGPEVRIRDAAGHAGLDVGQLPIDDTGDDPRAATLRAVELARAGQVRALVKGSLGIEELLAPVAANDSGLRGARRLSHAHFVDVPALPRGILLADAELNITPSLATKRDILHNTIALAQALGTVVPKVALIAARGSITPALPSTTDAAALQEMAAHGLFGEAEVVGPVTADGAIAAATRPRLPAAPPGDEVDVLVVPGMEAGTLLLRTLIGLTGALAAGIVLGAGVPIVAPLHGDSMEARIASAVLAALVAARGPEAREEAAPELVAATAAPAAPLHAAL